MKHLIDQLKKEIALYNDFIAILHRETENLVSRDYKGLYDTVSIKEHLLVRIDGCSMEREKLLKEAASTLGITGTINLSAIIERTVPGHKKDLKDCQRAILALIDSIKEINTVNSHVVSASMENINKTLALIGSFQPRNVYQSNGAYAGLSVKGHRLCEGA